MAATRPRALTLDMSVSPSASATSNSPTATATNTLLLTALDDLDIFLPDTLQDLHGLISAVAPIHSFSPLRSFRRIIVTFMDAESAARVRRGLDGNMILNSRVRVYYGRETPIEARGDEHLALPNAGKLFFISPPPSPPHGWEVRLEDAPNKVVHAEDLAAALATLNAAKASAAAAAPVSPSHSPVIEGMRRRSSTIIYQPEELSLPAIEVVDMTDDEEDKNALSVEKTKTMRPPVDA